MSRDLAGRSGLLLTAITCVATLWLAISGDLILYIHPRYVVFTAVLAAVGLVLCVAALVLVRGDGHEDHGDHDDHDDHDDHAGGRRWPRIVGATAVGLVALALVAAPPATLSSTTAAQRDITGTPANVEGPDATELSAAAPDVSAGFTVLDWSSLLRQSSDPAVFADRTVDVVGFVTPDPADPENVFYVSRFMITCCAVDAQPVGVPVYQEGWADELSPDDWVHVEGEFASNPSPASDAALAVVPDGVEIVEEPDEPYLF